MKLISKITIIAFFNLILLVGAFAQNDFENQFDAYEIINVDSKSMVAEAKSNSNGPITVQLLGYTIQLVRTDMIADDYISTNTEGVTAIKPKRAIPMNGFTSKGDRASLTIDDDFIYGYINDGNKTLFIEPASYFDKKAEKGSFVKYWDSDVKDDAPKTCGVTELNTKIKEIKNESSQKSAGSCFEVQYAICNDNSMVVKYGSSTGAENHAIGVTNNVNTLYDDEFPDEVIFIIEGQYNSTCSTCDPWSSSTDSEILLTSFRDWATSNLNITHDVASLWTNRDFDGSTIGLAYVGQVCTSYGYNVLQDWSSNATLKKVMVTHELGHNFGSGHDSSSGFIMSGSVSSTTTWSATSISDIENYYNSVSCLGSCVPQQASIQFQNASLDVSEGSDTGTAGNCGETFELLDILVEMNTSPTNTVSVSVSVDNASTAIANKDYELVNTSLTFTPTGSRTQSIQVRIFDDKVEETKETLILDLTINSGNVVAGQNMTETIHISSDEDVVSTICCSGGGESTYGNYNYLAVSTFYGNVEDAKMRTLVLASELSQAGLSAGYINSLSLNIVQKNSTAAFNNFRIGMTTTSATTLVGLSWLATTQTYNDDVTTVLDWNDFEFSTPFYWDGTSNLYIQFCFNNTAAPGYDVMQHTVPLVATGQMMEFQLANGTDGCSTSDIGGTYSNTDPIQPRMKFGQSGGAIVEEQQNLSVTTHLSVGETAHFYTSNQKVIASIKNTGSIDLGCVTATINTSGSSKLSANFGEGDRTEKTFSFTGNSNATSEVTIYYTDAELAAWSGEKLNLSMVQSSVPIASATESDVNLISSTVVSSNIGAGNQISYTGVFTGSGYFALTDVLDNLVTGDLNVDLIINQANRGLLLTSENGQSFRLSVSNTGILTSLATEGVAKVCLPEGDLFLNVQNKGIILRQADGGYSRISVNNAGNVISTNISNLPTQHVQLETGDFELEESSKGIILKSPNGQCYRIFVSNAGVIQTATVNCP